MKPLDFGELLELVPASPESHPALREGGVSSGRPGSRDEAGDSSILSLTLSPPLGPPPSLGQREENSPQDTETSHSQANFALTPPHQRLHLSKWHQHPGSQAESLGGSPLTLDLPLHHHQLWLPISSLAAAIVALPSGALQSPPLCKQRALLTRVPPSPHHTSPPGPQNRILAQPARPPTRPSEIRGPLICPWLSCRAH